MVLSCGYVQERVCVVLPHVPVKAGDRPLVAGKLHVLGHKPVGYPRQRVEPVQTQSSHCNKLDYVVTAADMGALMGEDIVSVGLGNSLGKIYFRTDNSVHKWSGDISADIDIFTQKLGSVKLFPHRKIGYNGVRRHDGCARKPNYRGNKHNDLHGVCAVFGSRRRQTFGYRLVDGIV